MKKKLTLSNLKFTIALFLLFLCFQNNTLKAQEIPLVYDVEFTGVDCTKPPYIPFEDLPVVEPLTDPFEWSDGSGRDTTFEAWTKRRAEIKAELEYYEVGTKPDKPDTMSATYENGVLTVYCVRLGDTLKLTSNINLPEGEGPFPVIIGMGSSTGSLPGSIFTSRNIATMNFDYTQVMAHQQVRGFEPINRLYPELIYMGAYSAWPWGVSRLIDGLELVAEELPIDLKHIAVSGCSFAGKMALWAGALDERIALTIPQEPGGGGAAAWRVSEEMPGVEKLGETDEHWFIKDMWDFEGSNVAKLPTDHHELVALVAPRAILVYGNTDYQWLADESGYVSCAAARKVWENFGIEDRIGYSILGGHGHCALPEVQYPELEAFVDKFLLGITTVNTDVQIHPFTSTVPEYWTDWWGSGEPEFAILDRTGAEDYWNEAECSIVGTGWNTRLDETASNGSYVVPKDGLSNLSSAATDSGSCLYFTFTAEKASTFYIHGLQKSDAKTYYSHWFRLDNNAVKITQGSITNNWEWYDFGNTYLTAGEHTLTISLRADGIKLDKILITSFRYPPGGMGETPQNLCVPDTTTKIYVPPVSGISDRTSNNFGLSQNYPNPITNNTTIEFEIPQTTFVSLKVYSLLGEEVGELAGKIYNAGKHRVEFNPENLSDGVYIYMLKADKFMKSKRMILLSE
ncbi:MAG: T9SS type A sorting domain-containing protein [Bacteroidales bacterium]|nr:T9SS type A sorting domain-containing protein [Bacteroidales bacterium]MBN2817530.1 T9SS type A sorting domain-containing protein [Bacteroidales bacterium]